MKKPNWLARGRRGGSLTYAAAAAVVRAVGNALDAGPVNIVELALQHAVKADQLIAR